MPAAAEPALVGAGIVRRLVAPSRDDAPAFAPDGAGSDTIVPATAALLRAARPAPPPGAVTRAVPQPSVTPSGAPAPGNSATPGSPPPAAPASATTSPVLRSLAGASQAPGASSLIRRYFGAQGSGSSASESLATALPAALAAASDNSPTVVDADPAQTQAEGGAGELSSRQWAELVDEVTRRIEGRISVELERRGRRHLPRTL